MFRIYENGNQFFNDNRGILKENPLETVFFVSNAENLEGFVPGVRSEGGRGGALSSGDSLSDVPDGSIRGQNLMRRACGRA